MAAPMVAAILENGGPIPVAILEYRPKFGNLGLNISAPTAPTAPTASTAKKLIHSESLVQCHSNASQLVHFEQVLGKLNFSPVAPSPVTNTQRKKNHIYSESVDPAHQCQMVLVQNPPLGGRRGGMVQNMVQQIATNSILTALW